MTEFEILTAFVSYRTHTANTVEPHYKEVGYNKTLL